MRKSVFWTCPFQCGTVNTLLLKEGRNPNENYFDKLLPPHLITYNSALHLPCQKDAMGFLKVAVLRKKMRSRGFYSDLVAVEVGGAEHTLVIQGKA